MTLGRFKDKLIEQAQEERFIKELFAKILTRMGKVVTPETQWYTENQFRELLKSCKKVMDKKNPRKRELMRYSVFENCLGTSSLSISNITDYK